MPNTKQLSVILVVIEDSDEDFETFTEGVKQSGVMAEVRRATTGDAGLTLLRELAPGRPVIVIMDLNTPATDGRAALAEIKADPALRTIPVVVFSTSANPKDIGLCYAAGANAYHVKPVCHPNHLQLVIVLASYWVNSAALAVVGGTHL